MVERRLTDNEKSFCSLFGSRLAGQRKTSYVFIQMHADSCVGGGRGPGADTASPCSSVEHAMPTSGQAQSLVSVLQSQGQLLR